MREPHSMSKSDLEYVFQELRMRRRILEEIINDLEHKLIEITEDLGNVNRELRFRENMIIED